jgi:hypothetical protein
VSLLRHQYSLPYLGIVDTITYMHTLIILGESPPVHTKLAYFKLYLTIKAWKNAVRSDRRTITP